MNLHSANSYWLLHDPLLRTYQTLNENISTEIAIVGAGISGALTAYQLLKAGCKIAIITDRFVGTGSTCASTSLLQYEIDIPLYQLINKAGRETAELSYALCHESIDSLHKIHRIVGAETVFKKSKSLLHASRVKDVSDLHKEYEARRKIGLRVTWMDDKIIKKEFGFDSPAGIYSEKAAQTDAYFFTQKIIQWCCAHGASIYDKEKVKKIYHGPRHVELITQGGHLVKAKYVVMASGYESVNWIKKNITRLHSTYVIVSEALTEKQLWKDRCLIWETARPYTYLRTTPDNRIIVGGKDIPFSNAIQRDRLISVKSKQLLNAFCRKFPNLPFFIDHAWAGTFAETKDGLPFIDTTVTWPRVFFALGFGGNGITFSQVAAEIISDIINGNKNPAANKFGFNRPSA